LRATPEEADKHGEALDGLEIVDKAADGIQPTTFCMASRWLACAY
jgi:hypothetical protein